MSIILDALKKAEKHRKEEVVPDENVANQSISQSRQESKIQSKTQSNSLFIPSTYVEGNANSRFLQKGGSKSLWIFIPFCLVILFSLSWFAYVRIFSKLFVSSSLKPVAAVSAPKKPTYNAEEIKKEALTLFEEGKIELSIEKFKKLTEISPQDFEAFNNLGVLLKTADKQAEAKQAYEKALKIKPNYPEALHNLGVLYLNQNNFTQAQTYLEKALSLKEDYADPFLSLGLILESQEKFDEAIKHYQEFLKLKPDADLALKGKIEMKITILETKKNGH